MKPLANDDVRDLMRLEIKARGSQRAYAKAAGVSAAYVSDILLGRRNPGPAIAKHHGLTYRVVVQYQRTCTKKAPGDQSCPGVRR